MSTWDSETMLTGLPLSDEDGGTIIDDGLSTCDDDDDDDDENLNQFQRRNITSAQAAAERSAGKQYKYFTLFLVSFALLLSAIVATVRYYNNPRMMSSSENGNGNGVVVDWNGNGLREKENALRMQQTLDYLIKYDVSDPNTLVDPSSNFQMVTLGLVVYSPQFLAATWIAQYDAYRISIPSVTDGESSREEYPFLQRYALAVLFFSTGGMDEWMWKVNFMRGWHECRWIDSMSVRGVGEDLIFGVSCDGQPELEEGQEDLWDGRRTVTGISLPPLNNMRGTLPPEVRHLRYLKAFHVQYNQGVTGEIPFQYGWLRHLTSLGLMYNNLSGKVPRTFSQLTKLRVLRLENNRLEGDSVEGDLNFLKEMRDLVALSVDYNAGIGGTIPDWISNLSKLRVLAFANTGMYGTLPPSMSKLTELRQLYLDDCDFEGSLDVIKGMTNLTHVYLEDNYFDEAVDETFFVNSRELVHLDVSNCSLVGTVPWHFFDFPNLEVLDMSRNNLTGALPAGALENARGSKLRFLSLHDNDIAGPVPPGIGELRNLAVLDLSGNRLTGDIPAEIVELGDNLDVLFLGRNDFDGGPVPPWLKYLHNLKELSLKGSGLNGTIPSWLGELGELQFLDLGENDLTGTIPQSLGNLTNLMVLILNDNGLQGELGLGDLGKLETLLVDDNALTGNTDAMCEHELVHFVADCQPRGDFDVMIPAELECECCTLCCWDANATCNDAEWLGNHQGIWEYGYNRVMWDFDDNGVISPLVNYNYLQSQP